MRTHALIVTLLVGIYTMLVILFVGCGSAPSDGYFYGALGFSQPKLIIANGSAVGTGPFTVAQFSLDGTFEKVLVDFTYDNQAPRGLAIVNPFEFLIAIEGTDGIQKYNVFSGLSEFVSNSNLTGTIFNMARTSNGHVFVPEGTTIESFDASGARIGNPRIPATVGTCTTMTAIRGATVTASGLLVVADTGTDDVYFYNVSNPSATTCSAVNTTLGNEDPVDLAYHPDGFVYGVTQGGTDGVYKFPTNGSAATRVYTGNAADNPTAIVVLPDGSLLVANDGNNNIIKISTSGTVLANPFMQNAFTQYVFAMAVTRTP